MNKPFFTYSEQINLLKNEKRLTIDNTQYAEDMLKRNSYFALISGYKHWFKNRTTKKYKDGTAFEDIVALYDFDGALREIFLKYLCKVERHIRSLISYYFSEKHGEAQIEYLNLKNYRHDTPKNIKAVSTLISKLTNYTQPDKNSPYIHHYIYEVKNVPLWVLLNKTTFGELSKMYSLLPQDLQIKVSSNFEGIVENQLGKTLLVLTKFRNICAHNERLFSQRIREAIPNFAVHTALAIPKKGNEYINGKSDLFAVVIALKYLLDDSDFYAFSSALSSAIDHYSLVTNPIPDNELYSAMGFPSNWKDIVSCSKC